MIMSAYTSITNCCRAELLDMDLLISLTASLLAVLYTKMVPGSYQQLQGTWTCSSASLQLAASLQ